MDCWDPEHRDVKACNNEYEDLLEQLTITIKTRNAPASSLDEVQRIEDLAPQPRYHFVTSRLLIDRYWT
jgi:hypothetical protein